MKNLKTPLVFGNATDSNEIKEIIANCALFQPSADQYRENSIIEKYGSSQREIYVHEGYVTFENDSNVEIRAENPLILPLYNSYSEVESLAILQADHRVLFYPEELQGSFACNGQLDKDSPIIVTCNIESFFKVSQTNYPVICILSSHLDKAVNDYKTRDIEKIQHVLCDLNQVGYHKLYLPVRPEHKHKFANLVMETHVQLIDLYQDGLCCDLTQYDATEDVRDFLDHAIQSLDHRPTLPKGHLAKPMKWENGYFHVKKNGIEFVEQNKEGKSISRFISSLIFVKARTRDEKSNNWGILLEWRDTDGVLHQKAIPMELFQTDGADVRRCLASEGLRIASDTKSRNLFQSYLMNYPTEQNALCVHKVGWHDNSFVVPHKTVGHMDDLIVYQPTHCIDSEYKSMGQLAQWRKQVAQQIEQHHFLVFALSIAFTGQLLTPLQQQGCGFHFKGASSKGKSTALKIASSVWGNPETFFRTWRATGNALESTAFIHNDSFLPLDEIGEIANPNELGNIVYMLANGFGKSRMSKSITLKPLPKWKVIFLSTGEKSLNEMMFEQGQKSKLGQEIRLIDIDIDESHFGMFDVVDFADTAAHQAIELSKRMRHNYGVAGEEWLEYLTANKEECIKEAKLLLDQYRDQLVQHHVQGHIIRVANCFALVAVAGELATRANITGWYAGTAFAAVQKIFEVWFRNFKYVDDYAEKEIISSIKSYLLRHEDNHFQKFRSPQDHHDPVSNRIGYLKLESNGDKYFYIVPELFKEVLCKPMDASKVIKVLKEAGLLDHDYSKSTKTVRLPGINKPTRVYAIKDLILSWNEDDGLGNIGDIGNPHNSQG